MSRGQPTRCASLQRLNRRWLKSGNAIDALATSAYADVASYNMPAAVRDLISVGQLLNMELAVTTAPDPTTAFIPLYNAPGYKTFVDEAQTKVGSEYEPAQSKVFTINTGKEASDYNFGQTSVGASHGGSWLYGFGASGAVVTTKSSLQQNSAATSVSVHITYDSLSVIDITPGLWYVHINQLLDSITLSQPLTFRLSGTSTYRSTSLKRARPQVSSS